jgi:hypothetical protein
MIPGRVLPDVAAVMLADGGDCVIGAHLTRFELLPSVMGIALAVVGRQLRRHNWLVRLVVGIRLGT